jgi:hypothetical protein
MKTNLSTYVAVTVARDLMADTRQRGGRPIADLRPGRNSAKIRALTTRCAINSRDVALWVSQISRLTTLRAINSRW